MNWMGSCVRMYDSWVRIRWFSAMSIHPTSSGLDPAGHNFSEVGAAGRLDRTDAAFVDAIHTSACRSVENFRVGELLWYPDKIPPTKIPPEKIPPEKIPPKKSL